MRVPRCQQEPAQPLQIRVTLDGLEEPGGKPLAAMIVENKDVRQIGEGCRVGYDARKSDLIHAVMDAKAKRMGDATLDDSPGNAG